MAVTRQQIRLAGCGAVAVLSLAVLLLYRPSAWAGYVAWTVSRIGSPLFALCVGMFSAGVVLVVFSRYRRKPELLAAALALSAALHLLLVATLTFWMIGETERPHGAAEVRLEVAPGLPSSIEDMIARQMREDLLDPLVQDEKPLETEKPSPAEPEAAADVPPVPAPLPDAPDREPTEMEPVEVAASAARRVEIGEAPAATARVEAEADMEQRVQLRPVETAAEPAPAVPAEDRRFAMQRAEVAPVPVADPAAATPAPELPVPDRAVRMEAPEIRRDSTVPVQRPEQAVQSVETTLDVLKLELSAVPESAPAAEAAEARPAADGRMELEIAAPRMETAEAPLRAVAAPVTPASVASVDSQAIPQELPGTPRRERPGDPQDVAAPVRAVAADVAPLAARAMQAEPLPVAESGTPAPVPAPAPAEEFAASRAASVAGAAVEVPRLPERPELAAVVADPGKSMAPGQAVPSARRGAEVPRMMESTASEAPPRAEQQPADSVRMQIALLLTLASPAGDTGVSTNAVQRELAAGRAAVEDFPARESSRRPAPGTGLPTTTLREPAGARTMVDGQAGAVHRDMPRRAAPAKAAERAAVRDDAGMMAGIAVRQSTVVVAEPAGEEPGAASRVPVPLALGGLPRSTAGGGSADPAPGRPEAPLQASRPMEPAPGSIAGATLRHGVAGRSAPASPEPGASAAAMPAAAEMGPAELVAGRVQAVQGTRGDESPAETASMRAGGVAAEALAAGRAVRGDAAILDKAAATRLAVRAPGASTHTGTDAPQAMPPALPAAPRRMTDPAQGGTAAAVGVAGVLAPRPDEAGVAGISVRQTQVKSEASVAAETDGGASRGSAPAAIASVSRAGGGTIASVPVPGRPDAPMVSAGSAIPVDGSIAGAELRGGASGRSAPARPEGGAAAAGMPEAAGMASGGLVAGRVQPVETRLAGGLAPAEESRGARGPTVPASALTLQRATAGGGTLDGAPAPDRLRPALIASAAPYRGDGTLAETVDAGHAAGMAVPGPVEAAGSRFARTMEDGGTVALPVAAGAVARTATAEGGGVSEPVLRVPTVIGAVEKAWLDVREEPPVFTDPQGGWKAPPMPMADRGTSGVRMSPGAEVIAVRRVEAGGSRSVGASVADAVRRLMSDDTARISAAGKKAIYELRSPEKRRRIEELGGSPETEAAVEQALIWLAGAQSDDGRWDVAEFRGVERCGGAGDRTDGNVAVTGLSLLAYLGAGYTHAGGRHGETVRKGLDWLIEGQGADGDLRRGGTMYDQAMATAAICESLSLTADRRLAGPARLAAGFIMNAQTPEAAWRYEPRNDSDTSVLGWQILALKSAEIAGVEIPPRHYAWSGMWLDQVRKGGGGLYAYKPGHGPTPVMTAEGWFCQLFMGEEVRRQGQQESIAYLLENPPEWNEKGRGTVHLYYWYYATLALRLSEVEEFDIWNKSLKTALLAGHRRDGPAAGSWDPVCQLGPRGGRIYSTAMAVLCLEVYYRYLPFYRRGTAER